MLTCASRFNPKNWWIRSARWWSLPTRAQARSAAFLLLFWAASAQVQELCAESASGTDLNNQGVIAAQKGDFEQAAVLLQQAHSLDSADELISKNLSGVLTDWAIRLDAEGQWKKAAELLERAVAADEQNGKAKVLLAEITYVTGGDLARSVSLWKSSFNEISAAQWVGVSQRIAQAERDLAIERGFTGWKTGHFQVYFEEGTDPGAAAPLRLILEREFQRLREALEGDPPPFTVLVYAPDSFQRVMGRKDWALGLYDGRIRVRLEDLGTDRIERILAHELAHAYLAQVYGPRLPIWIHEGFAQFQERGSDPEREEETERDSWVPLQWLDRKFQQPSGHEDITRAYSQSRQAVEFMIHQGGPEKFRRFLRKVGSGQAVEAAFDETFAPLRWPQLDQGILD